MEALAANSSVALNAYGSPSAVTIEYSTDKTTWASYTMGTTISLAAEGDHVWFRGVGNSAFSSNESNYYYFAMSGTTGVSGNVMSLLDYSTDSGTVPAYAFCKLFVDCTALQIAENFTLPAITLGQSCYLEMFEGCTGLYTAPWVLPAAILAEHCYEGMFKGDTSLVYVPEMGAVSLADYCCRQMFYGCTSMVKSPDLHPLTLKDSCYEQIFKGCSSLNSVKVAFDDWNTSLDSTAEWLDGVAADGEITCLYDLDDTRSVNTIPSGWTRIDLLPKGYRRVEYIESAKEQYIDTNLYADGCKQFTFKTKFQITSDMSINPDTDWQFIMSNHYYDGTRSYSTQLGVYRNEWAVWHNTPWRITTPSKVIANKNLHDLTLIIDLDYGEKFVCDSVVRMRDTVADASWCNYASPFSVFGRVNNSGTASTVSIGGKMHFSQFVLDGCVERNYVPVVRNSDSKPGLYDLCGSMASTSDSSFFINSGTSADFTWKELPINVPGNEIWYYAPEQQTLYDDTGVISHTFDGGKGVIAYSSDLDSVNQVLRATDVSTVFLPSGVTSIEGYAFSDCANLKSIELPDGLTSIGSVAFYNCTKLVLTSLPSGITSIQQDVFRGCTSLALTSLPSGITQIGARAFSGCTELLIDELPSVLNSIGERGFEGCIKISITSLPAGLTYIGQSGFSGCPGVVITELPVGVTELKKWAFIGTGIQTLTIHANMKTIDSDAFGQCYSLASITFLGTPESLSNYIFRNLTISFDIYVPWGEDEIAGAPWGATNATIHYNYTPTT